MIEVQQLTKRFDGRCALDGLELRFTPGHIYGLVGSNGSGKSTLLRHIAGIYAPDAGNVLLGEQLAYDNPRVKEQVFFLPDTPAFFRHADLEEMAAFFQGMYPHFSRERLQRLQQIFPLDASLRVEQMSKGMQRQLALMLALASGSRILLLDEAFDGLDPVVRQELKQLLIERQEAGDIVIIASHNLRELEDLCDHVTLLHRGRAVCSGDLEQLRGSLLKVQVVFRTMPTELELARLPIVRQQRTGTMLQLVLRGQAEELLARIRAMEPVFLESIQPSLEEIFIYELGVQGYEIQDLL